MAKKAKKTTPEWAKWPRGVPGNPWAMPFQRTQKFKALFEEAVQKLSNGLDATDEEFLQLRKNAVAAREKLKAVVLEERKHNSAHNDYIIMWRIMGLRRQIAKHGDRDNHDRAALHGLLLGVDQWTAESWTREPECRNRPWTVKL